MNEDSLDLGLAKGDAAALRKQVGGAERRAHTRAPGALLGLCCKHTVGSAASGALALGLFLGQGAAATGFVSGSGGCCYWGPGQAPHPPRGPGSTQDPCAKRVCQARVPSVCAKRVCQVCAACAFAELQVQELRDKVRRSEDASAELEAVKGQLAELVGRRVGGWRVCSADMGEALPRMWTWHGCLLQWSEHAFAFSCCAIHACHR